MEAVRQVWKNIPELEAEVIRRQEYLDGMRNMLSMALEALKKFSHVKEDDMTEEQMTQFRKAMTDKESALSELSRVSPYLGLMLERLEELKSSKEGAPAVMSPKANRRSDTQSVSSSSSRSRLKSQEVKLKEGLANLKINYEKEKQGIEEKIEELEFDLEDSSIDMNTSFNLNRQLERYQLKLKQLKRKYDKSCEHAHLQNSVAVEKIQAEDNSDQDLDEEDEKAAKVAVLEDEQRVSSPPLPPHHKGAASAEDNVSVYESLPGDDVYGGVNDGIKDKDYIMMQLMTKQMQLMEKTESSRVDKFLPEFHGDPAHWGNFKSAFDRIQAKAKMDDSEAMIKLQKVLKGKAKAAVEHLMANVSNVGKIMESLEMRYGRPEFVLDYLVEKAKTCSKPDITKPESIVEFGTSVEALVANIHAYNEMDYLNNKQLVTELVDKLPGNMKGNWFHWVMDDPNRKRNLEHFSKWLKRQVEVALLQIKPTVPSANSSSAAREEKKGKPTRGPGSQNTAAVAEEESETSQPTKPACVVCKKRNHPLEKCWIFQKKDYDDKWAIVKGSGLCYCCLKAGHLSSSCKSKSECGENGCKRLHHKLLHRGSNYATKTTDNGGGPKFTQAAETPSSSKSGGQEDAGTIGVSVYLEGTDGPLAIVPIRVRKPNTGKWMTTYALLDSGASRTLMSEALAHQLGMSGDRISYRYKNMGGELKINRNAMKVNLDISGRYRNAKTYPMTDVITVSEIGIPPYSINIMELKKRWPHLRRMKGDNLTEVVPEVVVGGDHAFLMAHRDLLIKTIDQPVAMRTVLGWVVQGKFFGKRDGVHYYVGGVSEDDDLHALVKKSFQLDDFGIVAKRGYSLEDKKAEASMKATTEFHDGRWSIGLLWRNDDEQLPTQASYHAALQRLISTEKRMQRDPDFAAVYKNKIEEYINKGFIRKLPPEEAAVTTKKTFYISHFGVTNPNKPGKFRLVFDAAAKVDGKSLNEKLLTGPDLLCSLTSVLWNFRCPQIGICADIEDMFHRVLIKKEDRYAQRFLWRDGDCSRKPEVYQMQVMIFGATSSPSCATYIKNINADRFEQEYPKAVHVIKHHMYCDDLLTGADTIEEAVTLRQEVSMINAEGGMHLKKFISNSPAVMSSIPVELRMEQGQEQKLSCDDWERVLGMWWNPADDMFSFKLNFHKVDKDVLNGRKPSKREMCSLVMSLFDPVGFLGNYKIKGMILLQRTWRAGVKWDQDIPDDIYIDWKSWIEELPKIEDIRIPRCYSHHLKTAKSIELHTFVDSSVDGYCGVCFLRVEHGVGVDVAFVASKIRVTPLKKSTIPRLELQAAVLGAKLAQQVKKDLEVKIDKFFYWSDSSTVLAWLRSTTARFKEFVANRVGYIQEVTDVSEWNWISTKDNVAEDATRSSQETDLSSNSRWLTGPPFLKSDPSEWPRKQKNDDDKGVIALQTGAEVVGELPAVAEELEDSLPEFHKFSSYYRLLRATAAVGAVARHWLNKWRKTEGLTSSYEKIDGDINSNLTSADIDEAEKRVIRHVQKIAFSTTLSGRAKVPLKNLKTFIDTDGIIRVKGRISQADADAGTKHPILLPGKHHVVDLLVDAEHRKNAHSGKATVFNNLRQRFWITGGRNVVRRCFARCGICRMARAKPVIPEMGDLPSYRLAAYQPVFSFCGVDFCGPFEITVGRRHEKRWVALFTCLVTRAVYVDIVTGLSADEMMMVLSRFIDTHGLPKNIYSDNATNFKAVVKELGKLEKLCGMKWTFIPPASPHFGGAWERMVGAIKKVLKNILHEKFPREEVLRTALKAAEKIVNTRPLTYVSSDVDDPEALTPNHFLRPANVTSCSGFLGEGIGQEAESMRSMHKKSQNIINQFWRRWTQEVLPDMIRRTKWYDTKEPVRVGDLVLLVDELQPRNTWVKGIVTKTFPGKDGLVRVVEVATRLRNNNSRATYRRSVAKIVPLGVNVEDSGTSPSGMVPKSGAGNVKT